MTTGKPVRVGKVIQRNFDLEEEIATVADALKSQCCRYQHKWIAVITRAFSTGLACRWWQSLKMAGLPA